jgi:hypothetical protein
MSKSYKELNALPPETFLDQDKFVTDWDTINPHKATEQYNKGVEIGQKADSIFIAADGTWGASMKDKSSLTSYEGIGYHAHTASLLKGFLASGAKIIVYRRDKPPTVIKEAFTG